MVLDKMSTLSNFFRGLPITDYMTQVRFPNQKRLEAVPAALEEVFHDLDDTGIAAFSRGNSVYEITDAPLSTLRDRVREHVKNHLGGMVTDKEQFNKEVHHLKIYVN